VLGEQLRYSIHQSGFDQGLVALDVHDYFIISQSQYLAGLGQAIAARWVIFACQNALNAMGVTGDHDFLTVTCNHYANGLTGLGEAQYALGDADHHRRTANIGQWFIG
jgi:hypothetical protein